MDSHAHSPHHHHGGHHPTCPATNSPFSRRRGSKKQRQVTPSTAIGGSGGVAPPLTPSFAQSFYPGRPTRTRNDEELYYGGFLRRSTSLRRSSYQPDQGLAGHEHHCQLKHRSDSVNGRHHQQQQQQQGYHHQQRQQQQLRQQQQQQQQQAMMFNHYPVPGKAERTSASSTADLNKKQNLDKSGASGGTGQDTPVVTSGAGSRRPSYQQDTLTSIRRSRERGVQQQQAQVRISKKRKNTDLYHEYKYDNSLSLSM